jgi:hypothetical protein
MPAYALLRAAVAQDADAAGLLVGQARKAGTLDLLVFNVAHVAARAMLGAEGYDVARVLRVLDSWMDEVGMVAALSAARGLFVPKPTREVVCHRTYCG